MMDTTAWIINNEFANFVLLNTMAIKYMCMVGYTFMHGCNVFKNCGKDTATSYKCITMMLACTGGGILVPIFLNTIPVTIGIDAYPVAILTSFLLHLYFPILREVVDLSPIFKVRKKHPIQQIFSLFYTPKQGNCMAMQGNAVIIRICLPRNNSHKHQVLTHTPWFLCSYCEYTPLFS